MASIHPTAVLDPRVRLAEDVTVGPFAVIEGSVVVGPGTAIGAGSVVLGHTQIGPGCRIGPAAQHTQFDGADTSLVIGAGTVIREGASVHRSTKPGIENATRVGTRCFLMAASHVGHDSRIGDGVVLANAVLIGGHCEVGTGAFLGGGCVIHQHCRVGRLAVICGNETVTRDTPPFAAVRYGGMKGYNAVGCRRGGIGREAGKAIRAAYQCLHSHRTTAAAVAAILEAAPLEPEVQELLDFIAGTKRGIQPSVHFISRMRQGVGDGDDDV